ncbi:MAG: biotin transporter BioY [Clostridiales bacterium]|jgi:biotin transport system substrate-specific component|nr:biotin transporter BioY [Clostridiales bacterium]
MSKKILNLAYIAMGAALIAICAWITIPIGPVPFTMQTFAVVTIAGLLGWKRGVASIFVYIALGALGAPVFSGFGGGISVLAGVTGGYIVGFIFTALIVGLAADRFKGILPLALSMFGGILCCYAFGTIWFMVVYMRSTGTIGLISVLSKCVFPYILPDLIKIVLGILLTKRLRKYIK